MMSRTHTHTQRPIHTQLALIFPQSVFKKKEKEKFFLEWLRQKKKGERVNYVYRSRGIL